jgi:ribosome biogenesis protein MAK21
MNVHPAMKPIIIKSIEAEVVFKRGNHTNAKYYSIITLNQTVLSSLDHDVANKLLDIYFGVFTALLNKENANKHSAAANATGANAAGKHSKFVDEKKQDQKDKKLNKKARLRAKKEEEQNQFDEESNAKLVSAVLTGVNRAFPFSKVDDEVFDKHLDTLFRITHQGNFNTSIQALILIFQVSNAKQVRTNSCKIWTWINVSPGRLSPTGSTGHSMSLSWTSASSTHRSRPCILTFFSAP